MRTVAQAAVQKVHAAHGIEIQGVRVEDLGLDFTLPGYPAIELVPNGSNIPVTIDNVGSYVEKVIDLTLSSGVQRQVEAFRTGFSQVFPYSALRAFTPNELVMLFGRVEEDWTLESTYLVSFTVLTFTDPYFSAHGLHQGRPWFQYG
jgi:E3 ubiquitin-protein ligase TRIP12